MRRATRVRPPLVLFAGAVVLTVAGVIAVAQGPLAQIHVSEADAREWLQQTLLEFGGPTNLAMGSKAGQVLATFKKLPASAKGPLTTQLYAWAKSVLMTPAFKARYARTRTEQKPVEQIHQGTVDDELKALIAEKNTEMEDGWKGMEATGIKEVREAAAQQRKEWPAQREKFTPSWRADIEQKRAEDRQSYQDAVKVWTERYPVDPNDCIARALREFINTTADVDYAAKQREAVSEGGSGLEFVNEAYNRKPWQWRYAYEWGPEAITAARAAAQAWLKEMGK